MRVTILAGIPGSGKSSWVKKNRPGALICSADDYFVFSDGKYQFDAQQLGEAHRHCMSRFLTALSCETSDIVVDNTNTTLDQIAPYIAVAEAYRANVEVVGLFALAQEAYDRCVHDVPLRQIERMEKNLVHMMKRWPARWPRLQVG